MPISTFDKIADDFDQSGAWHIVERVAVCGTIPPLDKIHGCRSKHFLWRLLDAATSM